MPVAPVDSLSDPRLDSYRNVPDPQLVRERGLFVAEGRLVVRRLLTESPLDTESVMVTDAARRALDDVIGTRPNLPVYLVPQDVMNGVVGFNIHRGCLAIGRRPPAAWWKEIAAGARVIVAVERVANADNIGGVFRNAAAFGAGAVLLDPSAADPLYRKAIRTSLGAALIVPFARAAPWPGALLELRAQGVATVALTPGVTARPIDETVAALGGRRIAVVLGHEGDGLSRAALDACEERARIPIASHVDSLNVAAAAAIALYEIARRRCD